MKTIIYLLLFLSITSCGAVEEREDYEKAKFKYATKQLELDYIRSLIQLKGEIEWKIQRKNIDSLILAHKLELIY